MNAENVGLSLHDRATRGQYLSTEEVQQLEAWYELQDRSEAMALLSTTSTVSLDALQFQVDQALAQLSIVSQRIQHTAEENDALRSEIAGLRRQVAQKAHLQLA